MIADTLQYLSGERFDIVIDASQPIADYWIRIRELSPCSKRIEALAVLRYHEGDAMNQEIVAFVDKKPPNYDDIYPKNHVGINFKDFESFNLIISYCRFSTLRHQKSLTFH